MKTDTKALTCSGPILIIGASGFIGSNIFKRLLKSRTDVYGTSFSGSSWRIIDAPPAHKLHCNILDTDSLSIAINKIKPKTIFDCSSYGSYSFEADNDIIHRTNYLGILRLLDLIEKLDIAAYVHSGSSSEYGKNSSGPTESSSLQPNSHYAVSKAAASSAIYYYGKYRGVPALNLRLYSVYGPYEDTSRLIPNLCLNAINKKLPRFATPTTTRDFIHVDDVCEAFLDAATKITPPIFGEPINIGSGLVTSLSDLANISKSLFDINDQPIFDSSFKRYWDTNNWYANIEKAKILLDWEPKISLPDGLILTKEWWAFFIRNNTPNQLTKSNHERPKKGSVSAVIACYKDEEAVPIMYKRLLAVFQKMSLDYEIIFVNDCSPDNTAEVIRQLSGLNPNVIGINHSRNFGSQAAFRSGMEMATKEACVLLDGDLQDPPELIEYFVEKWRNGADIVYGRRMKREMPIFLEVFYRGFYTLFAALSEIPIPKDAGDFSLIDRRAVNWMLQCRERDFFLRGIRAYVGFKQESVDYLRPERMFGKSTNNWIRNIGWAKKGIFSFTRIPLHIMSAIGGISTLLTIILIFYVLFIRITDPNSAPRGVTFMSLLIMFFGSFSILGLGLLGEYIGKILEEVKYRPSYIRRTIISRGEIRESDGSPSDNNEN